MKVLVTGAGALLGQGIIRSLQRSRLHPYIIAVDPSPLAAGLYWADESFLIPMATASEFMEQFSQVLERTRPDVILVGTDVELALLAQHRATLEQTFSLHVLVSSPEVVAIADDKYATYRFLQQHQFPHPRTCLPGEEQALIEAVGFPLVVKPRVGARSVGLSVVHNVEDLQRALQVQPQAVIQECVGTAQQEYTAGVLYFEGACRAAIVMRRDLRDGNTYRAYVEQDPDLLAQVKALAAALQPYGPANFQFRLDNGKVKVFEINGRFSGTTPLRALAGFNEVELSLRHLLLGEPIVQPAVEPLVLLRHWSETVVHPAQLHQMTELFALPH